jgi:hypothetical protein
MFRRPGRFRFAARIAVVLGLALPVTAAAQCQGTDLIAAMPAAERAALEARSGAAPFPRGTLWVARKGDAVITLVGTYHLADPRHAATLAALAPAIQAAHTLLVEAGPDEIASLKAEMQADPSLIVAPAGQSLYADLPPAIWAQLSTALKSRGVPGPIATRLRPWYVMVLLSISQCDIDAGTVGLDMQLMAAAKDRALPVRSLEPADTVFSIFNGLSRADQLALMNTALAEDASSNDGMVTLTNAYFRGETRLMWEFSAWETARLPGVTPAEAQRQQDLLERVVITDRNRTWIPVIEAAAAEGPVLAAFGALHLPGAAGVLNLLAADGWTITPLTP